MAVVLAMMGLVPIPASAEGGVRLSEPSGRHAIGTVSLHLVDRSRADPWVAATSYRELMVSVWYPAV